MIYNRFFIKLGEGLYNIQTDMIIVDHNNIVQIKNDLMINNVRELYIVNYNSIIKAQQYLGNDNEKFLVSELLDDNYAILTNNKVIHYHNGKFIFFTFVWLAYNRIKKIKRYENNKLAYYIVLTNTGELYLCNIIGNQSVIDNGMCIKYNIIDFSNFMNKLVTVSEYNMCDIIEITPRFVPTCYGSICDYITLSVNHDDSFDGYSKKCHISSSIIIDIENNKVSHLSERSNYFGWFTEIKKKIVDLSMINTVKKILLFGYNTFLLTDDGCIYICNMHSCHKYVKTSDFFVDICTSKLSYTSYYNNSDSDCDSINYDTGDYVDDTKLLLNCLSTPKSDAILGITASNTIYDLTRDYKFLDNITLKVNLLVKNGNNFVRQL
jgi:hypothetical protein